MIQIKDLLEVIPFLIIAFSATFILLLEVIIKKSETVIFGFSLMAIAAAIVTSFNYFNKEMIIFNQFLRISNASLTFSVIILISMLITVIASKSYIEKENVNFGEYYSMLLFE